MIPFRHEIVRWPLDGMANLAKDRVLALTFFVDAENDADYRRIEAEIGAIVGLHFTGTPPPASVIAQAPEGGEPVVLSAATLVGEGEVERKERHGLHWTVATAPGIRQIHGAGVKSDDPSEVFARMAIVLDQEGLHYGHLVRQWGYIEGMLDVTDESQGYQEFNDARSRAYERCEFPAGYPAATGIGQTAGGVVLEFIAVDGTDDVRVAAISNPNQIDAHAYSEGVLVGEQPDKTPPKFERAKSVARDGHEVVFVSGTASIIGEESVGIDDVAAQTRTTVENIVALLPGGKLSDLRAYVKRPEDTGAVREVLEESFGDIPALYVQADVCRDELLVEIEGIYQGGPR